MIGLETSPRPRPIERLEYPMELVHRIARALARLRERCHAWHDTVADRPVDPAGWWR
ncbi:MAG TPA: hypothetical protein VGN37_30310 [Actinocatenispora sp.]